MFIGRQEELQLLQAFSERSTAGLVVCSGRRRIGKSTLIETFAADKNFYEFYGLAPRDDLSNQDQLNHFGELIGQAFKVPSMHFDSWNQALSTLSGLTLNQQCIILLDEISWMASRDKDFAGKLKGIWDTQFKKNNQLILVICGSVSSWIQENILQDKGFMGRISLEIKLQELPLADANVFWDGYDYISSYEKFKILSVTGGIPRYLEEIKPNQTAEQNIKQLCFTKGGVLTNEFEKIFNDIFQSKSESYKAVAKLLVDNHLSIKAICDKLNILQSGSLHKKLNDLEESGFIARDYVWQAGKRKKKLSKYRLKDNYLRFYLKYIEPKKNLIEQGIYQDLHLDELDDWYSIMGLQFENLVLNNIKTILKKLNLSPSSLLSASPYFQNQTKRTKACQIDLLIETKFCLYICEIKSAKKITSRIIDEVSEKINRIKTPKTTSIRPILIYQGELSAKIEKENFFTHLIEFNDLLMET